MFIVPISPMSPLAMETNPAVQKSSGSNLPFADVLSGAVNELREAQQVSKQDAYNLAMGQSDDFHTLMIHSTQATAALEMTVQLASRAVSAYREIMQIQV